MKTIEDFEQDIVDAKAALRGAKDDARRDKLRHRISYARRRLAELTKPKATGPYDPSTQAGWEEIPLALRVIMWPPDGVERTAEELAYPGVRPEQEYDTEADYDADVARDLRAWERKVRGESPRARAGGHR